MNKTFGEFLNQVENQLLNRAVAISGEKFSGHRVDFSSNKNPENFARSPVRTLYGGFKRIINPN